MIPLFFLGLALAIPLLGLAIMAISHRARRARWDDGIKEFEQRRRALERVNHPINQQNHPINQQETSPGT